MKLENRFTVPVPRAEAWRVLLDVERIAPCMPGAKLLSRDGDDFTGQVKVKVGPINLTYGGQASFITLDEAAGVAVIMGSGKETRGTGTAKATITCRLLDQGDSTDIEVDTDLAVTGKPASFGRGVLADVSAKLVDQFAASLADEIREGGVASTPAADAAADAPADAATAPAADGPAIDTAYADDPVAVDVAPEDAAMQDTPAATGPAVSPDAGGTSGAAVSAGATPSSSTASTSTSTGTATAPRRPRPEAEPIDLVGTAGLPVLKRALPVVAALVVIGVLVARQRR